MSPTILILSSLLLSLILGSTESGQRMEPGSLLRQTLRYWRKIYKTYSDEVALGYCWTGYLLKISNEWSTNLFTPTLNATEDYSDMTVAKTLFNESDSREKRLSHATARSAISKFTNDLDKHRVTLRSKMIQKRRIINKTEETSRIVQNNNTEWNSKIDENERIARMIDSIKRRRRALSIVPELLRDERETSRDGHEFSSRGTSSRAVNPPNPRDDDKVDSGSTDLGKEDSHRKVLHSLTSHHDSFVEDAFASRSFSFKVTREGSLDGQRFPFRWYSSLRKRNSRVIETLSDPWIQEDHGIKEDLTERRASSNNDRSSPAQSHSQFRRINADVKRSRVSVVKLMDSEGNSSCDLTINSKTSRRKPEELSRDLLLSPREGSAIAERSLFEFRGSGEDALKRNVPAIQNGQRKRHEETTLSATEEIGELNGRKGRFNDNDTSVLFVGSQKVATNVLRKLSVFPYSDDFAEIEAGQPQSRGVRSISSLSNVERFNRNYEDSTSQLIRRSRQIVSQRQLQLPDDVESSIVSGIRSFIVAIFGTLGMFVHIGRHIINVVRTNAALACTKEYLWSKIIKWIDE